PHFHQLRARLGSLAALVLRKDLGRVQALIALLRTCNGLEKSGIESPKSAASAARSCYLIHIVLTGCEQVHRVVRNRSLTVVAIGLHASQASAANLGRVGSHPYRRSASARNSPTVLAQ